MLWFPTGAVFAVPTFANGDAPHGLVADVSVDVSEDVAPCRDDPAAQCFPCFGAVPGGRKIEHTRDLVSKGGPQPLHRDPVVRPQRLREEGIDQWAVVSSLDGEFARFLSSYFDFLRRAHRLAPLVSEPKEAGAIWMFAFLVDVALGANVVGHAPGERFVSSEYDSRHSDVSGACGVHARA